MAKKCPPQGKRVCFRANAVARALYSEGAPADGECGTVIPVAVPGGKRTCLPGPRGGLVYVRFDRRGITGVFRPDLVDAKGKSLGRARRRRR